MTVLIRDSETDLLIREMAARTGETITQAVKMATKERLARLPTERPRFDRDKLDAILARIRSYPVTDERSPDEILGYDKNGLPS